jgi:hypothetical protein
LQIPQIALEELYARKEISDESKNLAKLAPRRRYVLGIFLAGGGLFSQENGINVDKLDETWSPLMLSQHLLDPNGAQINRNFATAYFPSSATRYDPVLLFIILLMRPANGTTRILRTNQRPARLWAMHFAMAGATL